MCKYFSLLRVGNPEKAVTGIKAVLTHSSYLSEEQVEYVSRIFYQNKHDHVYFVKMTASTTNSTESLYSILFEMVSKKVAIGMDLMQLAAAFSCHPLQRRICGIIRILSSLFDPGISMKEAVRLIDNDRN